MSKTLFTQEAINMLRKNSKVTYISEKSISFTPEFRVEIARCKTKYDAIELFINVGIEPGVFGEQRLKSLYNRYKSQYHLKGAAAFTSENRGRKKLQDKKTYEEADLEEKLRQAEERLKAQDAEIDMLKKFIAFLPSTSKKANRFAMIQEFINYDSYLNLNSTELIKLLCSYLGVSVSGFYKYKKVNETSTIKKQQDEQILDYIIKQQNRNFRKGKSKFKKIGYRQMTALINKSGEFNSPINHKRVYRIMKANKMLSEFRQRNPYKTAPCITSEHRTFNYLLDSNFDSPFAYNVLCTDITYLICDGMKAYMSAIKDAATGKIVSYAVSNTLKIDFVIDTINQLDRELLNDETMIHSDQGVHYTSPQFSKLLNNYGITQSMSRRGKCTDNAPIESFFGHFKCEVAYESCTNMSELVSIIDEYMVYYNYERPQVHKQKMTPHEVECQLMCI